MKESTGYTVTLNIIITFVIIIFAFLSAALIFFKSNKVSNIITNAIEKYEGYNTASDKEILSKLESIGYNKNKINCTSSIKSSENNRTTCGLMSGISYTSGSKGFCIYFCDEGDYYYYKIRTNMMINIPIINNVLNIPIYTNTNRLYNFEKNIK